MSRLVTSCALFLFLAVNLFAGTGPEVYLKFKVDSPADLKLLTRVVSIDHGVDPDGTVYAYANQEQLAEFLKLGIDYETLPHPGSLIVPRMSDNKSDLKAWDAYPTYDAYVAMMNQFAADFPSICAVEDVGTTIQGRSILYVRISDNVSIEEEEPEVMHTSSMHGDETTGYVLMLRLIDSILTSYGTDADITRLVDSMEIWINPLANPDGTYQTGNSSVSGAIRGNAAFVDLNRNFPDPSAGDHPDGNAWQPETVIMMNLAGAHNFVISANYHGGEEVVNYPWDTWSRRHADDSWWQLISHLYADTARANSPAGYLSGFDAGITNGFDWYHVDGGRQDYMTYYHRGREVTVELSSIKLLAASLLPAHWEYNKRSLLQYIENALYGIRGLVTDINTSLPLDARIAVVGHDADNSEVKTDPDVGDYYRMIEAGTHDLVFTSPGYLPDTAFNVGVTNWTSTRVDMALSPLPSVPILTFADENSPNASGGDIVDMNVTLTNEGGADGTGVVGTLSTSDINVTVTQPSSTFPTLPAIGGQATSTSAYQFSIVPGVPQNHQVDFSLDVTGDGGYSGQVLFSVSVASLVEDYETGDFSKFPWSMGGSAAWTVTSTNPYEGTVSAQSGSITHSQTSTMNATVEVGSVGDILFALKVSSESGWDFLRFKIDGVEKDSWSGEAAWTEVSFPVTAGVHTFTWTYEKDGNTSEGSDRAWVDKIVFPVLESNLSISTSALPDWTVGQAYSQQLTYSGGLGQISWSDKNGDLAATGLVLNSNGSLTGVPLTAETIDFTAEVADGASGGAQAPLSILVNPSPLITTTSLPDGETGAPYTVQLEASGGTAPLGWIDLNGDLAATGLTMANDGLLSGIPAAGGLISLTVQLEGAAGAQDSKLLSFEITSSCCVGRVGDVNGIGGDEPTVSDIGNIVDFLFISGASLPCNEEADVNQSGGSNPANPDITVSDIGVLVDYLFITGNPLLDCL